MLSRFKAAIVVALVVVMLSMGGYAVWLSNHHEASCENAVVGQVDRCKKENADDRIADYTLLLAAATFLLVLITASQIVFLIGADETARKTAQAALDANRPWIDFNVKVTGSLITFEGENTARAPILISIMNIGNSPAVWTSIRAVIIDYGADTDFDETAALRSAAVFPNASPTEINTHAFMFRYNRGWVLLKMRVDVFYGFASGTGKTSKQWLIEGFIAGGTNLTGSPILEERMPLRHLPEADRAS